ncbi:MAG TPA: molecular chaperone DnaK [Anaerolineae bacterium]|nr:molecular chaperone DnaK [Anaerolineae bacterium]
MSKIIGIDLGTTNCVLAVMEGRKPVIIPNAEGERLTPTVVALDPRTGQFLLGTAAKRQAVSNPENTVSSVKRFVGRRFDDPEVQHDVRLSPYHTRAASDGGVSVRMGEVWYSPPDILAMTLRKLKGDAEKYLGTPVAHAVVTVPTYFDEVQRRAIKKAATIAGLEALRIVSEAIAASLAYGLDKTEDQTIAVYHLGGGTFDISILYIGDGVFEVKSTNGDTWLGGDDFDQDVINWMAEDFRTEHGIDLRNDPIALERLKEAAENAKIELSSTLQTEMNLPFITADASGPKHLNASLSRAMLEELTDHLVEKSIGPCRQALNDAGLSVSDINEVILVGQQTRMPAVRERVSEFFGREPRRNIDPAEAVATGAALQAGVLGGQVDDVLLLDVTPLTLSIETQDGTATPLIQRNTTIPTRKSDIFTTSADMQTQIRIAVFQGERSMASDNLWLGTFVLDGIPPAPRGVAQIQVTFDIDADGILYVSAKDKATGREKRVTIIAPERVPPGRPQTPRAGEAGIRVDADIGAVDVGHRLLEERSAPTRRKAALRRPEEKDSWGYKEIVILAAAGAIVGVIILTWAAPFAEHAPVLGAVVGGALGTVLALLHMRKSARRSLDKR